MHGAEEADLVYSGLEETMITATHEIMNCWKSNPSIPDMRTAAYVVAINKVGLLMLSWEYFLKSESLKLKRKLLCHFNLTTFLILPFNSPCFRL